jgi:hypothetical protein
MYNLLVSPPCQTRSVKECEMSAKRVLLAVLLSSTVNVMLYAQNPAKPDLSGTWKLNVKKSKLAKGSDLQSATLVITVSGQSLQILYSMNGRDWSETYTPDGKERKISEVRGAVQSARAHWKGAILVTESSAVFTLPDQPYSRANKTFHYEKRWKLSNDGLVLTVEQDDPWSITAYDKQ